jgi:hypothetical protein
MAFESFPSRRSSTDKEAQQKGRPPRSAWVATETASWFNGYAKPICEKSGSLSSMDVFIEAPDWHSELNAESWLNLAVKEVFDIKDTFANSGGNVWIHHRYTIRTLFGTQMPSGRKTAADGNESLTCL